MSLTLYKAVILKGYGGNIDWKYFMFECFEKYHKFNKTIHFHLSFSLSTNSSSTFCNLFIIKTLYSRSTIL